MHRTNRRLLIGVALAGAAVLAVGAPAVAATHAGTATHHRIPAQHISRAPVVEIGTATQYVRDADGSIRQVTPR